LAHLFFTLTVGKQIHGCKNGVIVFSRYNKSGELEIICNEFTFCCSNDVALQLAMRSNSNDNLIQIALYEERLIYIWWDLKGFILIVHVCK